MLLRSAILPTKIKLLSFTKFYFLYGTNDSKSCLAGRSVVGRCNEIIPVHVQSLQRMVWLLIEMRRSQFYILCCCCLMILDKMFYSHFSLMRISLFLHHAKSGFALWLYRKSKKTPISSPNQIPHLPSIVWAVYWAIKERQVRFLLRGRAQRRLT